MTLSLSEADRAALREEIRHEVKTEMKQEEHARRWRHFLVSLAVYLVVFGIPAAIAVVMLTRAGMITVPLLTERMYHPVAPTRVIVPLVGSDSEVIWQEALARAKYDKTVGDITLTMNETDLTTVIREGLVAQAENLPFKADGAQVVLDKGHAELFFYTERAGRAVPVLLTFVPGVDRTNNLSVEVTEAQLGGAEMPELIRSSMAKLLNSFLRNEFASQLPPGFSWRRCLVERDSLSVVFTVPQ